MKSDEQEKFLNWYEECENNNYVFHLQKELLEYCRSDIDTLRRSMIKKQLLLFLNIPKQTISVVSQLCG